MRSTLLLFVALAAAGCASSDAGTNACGINLQVTVSPTSATVPGTLRAREQFDDLGLAWTRAWSVTRGGSSAPVPFRDLTGDGTQIEVTANQPGSYHFRFLVGHDGQSCTASGDATVTTPGGATAVYRLRITPPAASGLPRQERVVVMHARTPLDQQQFSLEAGLPFDGVLRGPQGGVAGTIRFLSDDGAPLDVLAATDAGGGFHALLLGGARYTPLLVPLGVDLAPRALPRLAGAALAQSTFVVDGGAGVTGVVRDEQGQPLSGARVVLRQGSLPSTVGVTDGQGSFALRAAPGAAQIDAQSEGRPDLVGGPIAIADGATLALAWSAPRYSVAAQVVASDGTTPMAGAEVVVRTSAPVPSAGRVALSGQAPIALDGQVAQSRRAAQDGSLPLLLPPGGYALLAAPPAGAPDGVTSAELQLVAAASWRLALQPRHPLIVRVTDGAGAPIAGVRAFAVERGRAVAAPAIATGPDGVASLQLDAGAAADLYLDPPPGAARHFARAHLVAAPDAASASAVLSPGLLLGGTVLPQAGAPIPGALVEAVCEACADPSVAATATSDDNGHFALYLPDPGGP